MNVFMTNLDPQIAAYEHCTVHRIKMIIETAQMLCSAHRILDGDKWADKVGLYKSTHVNHPSTKFVRSGCNGYAWTYELFVYLCEYQYRARGVEHASARLIPHLVSIPRNAPNNLQFNPVLAAADDQAHSMWKSEGIERAYQVYLNNKFREWRDRDKPIRIVWKYGRPSWLDADVHRYADFCGSK